MVTMVTHLLTLIMYFFPSEFTRRWCSLNDGTFSYYENDKSSNPNGGVKTSEIVCVAVDPPDKHGYVHANSSSSRSSSPSCCFVTHSLPSSSPTRYEYTFELYSESKRLYLFGTDDPDSHKAWVKSIAKVTGRVPVTLNVWTVARAEESDDDDVSVCRASCRRRPSPSSAWTLSGSAG